MELNEVHTTHEHASLNLKVLLLVFAVALVAALGYGVYRTNHSAINTTDEGLLHPKKTIATKSTTTKTTTPATTADNTVACGDKAYAFSMTFGDLWKGYKIKEVKPTDNAAIIYCYVNVPTTDSSWATASSTNFAGYVSIFAISVYTPTQWTAAQSDPEVPTKLGSTTNYVWSYSLAQAYPDILKPLADNVPTVAATFAIN